MIFIVQVSDCGGVERAAGECSQVREQHHVPPAHCQVVAEPEYYAGLFLIPIHTVCSAKFQNDQKTEVQYKKEVWA
jgi:hypothetical protein